MACFHGVTSHDTLCSLSLRLAFATCNDVRSHAPVTSQWYLTACGGSHEVSPVCSFQKYVSPSAVPTAIQPGGSIVLFANAGGGGGGGAAATGRSALAERNSISTADPADGGVGGGGRGRGLVLLVGWCAPSRSTYLLLPRLLSCRWRKLGCLAGARGLDELFGRPRQQRRQQQHPATAAHTQSSAVAAAPP